MSAPISLPLPPRPDSSQTRRGFGSRTPLTLPFSTGFSSTSWLDFSRLSDRPQTPRGQRPPRPDIGLLEFTQLTYESYAPAPHHRLLADALEKVERGEIKRLMVFMPPRHGKSELASVRFPAWYLGRNPDRRVIAASYGSVMANKFSRRARNLIDSPAFRRIFPDTELAGDAAAVQFWAIEGKDGQYNAAGVGGGITGEGADLLLIDDPVKDAEAAASLTIREKTYDWYTSTAYTRLNDERGAIVLIQTRWHEDDLAGKLLRDAAEGGEQWHVLRLPALADGDDPLGRKEGEALWPARFPVERLNVIRSTLRNNDWWDALYQQTPPEALGGRYFRSWSPTKNGEGYHVWTEAEARAFYGLEEDAPFPPAEWQKWASVDGGVRDPWCTHFFARTPDRTRVFVYRELYGPNVQVPQQAQRINVLASSIGEYATGHEGDRLSVIKCDPAMFNKRANVGVSDAEIYRQQGVPLTRAYNERVMGWRRVLEALEPRDDGYPGVVILEGKAPNLVRTLPRLTADPDNPEDIEDGQEDHAADCFRYGINPAAASDAGVRTLAVAARMDPDDDREGSHFPDLNQSGVQNPWYGN